MNIIPNIFNTKNSPNFKNKKGVPSTDELVNRGFDPKNGKIDMIPTSPLKIILHMYESMKFIVSLKIINQRNGLLLLMTL